MDTFEHTDEDGDTLEVHPATATDTRLLVECRDKRGNATAVYLDRDATLSLYEALGDHLAATALDAEPTAPHVPTEQGTVLEDAQAAVYGDRGADYGHPRIHWTRTAILWTGLLHHKLADGEHLEPEDVGRLYIADKLSRDVNHPKRDNRVDMAGYALCLDRIETGR